MRHTRSLIKRPAHQILGPVSISSLWSGGFGWRLPDSGSWRRMQLSSTMISRRWLIQPVGRGFGAPTNGNCVPSRLLLRCYRHVHRYGFLLGTNFSIVRRSPASGWPDGYHMSMNVFNSRWHRRPRSPGPSPSNALPKMLTGLAGATVLSPRWASRASVSPCSLPIWMARPLLQPAPATLSSRFPTPANTRLGLFHADFVAPGNTNLADLSAARRRQVSQALCPGTEPCPRPGGRHGHVSLDGSRPSAWMPRLAYRNFSDHESVVGNYAVSANGVAGIRWFELRNVTNGSVDSLSGEHHQPDTTWRWNRQRRGDGSSGKSPSRI